MTACPQCDQPLKSEPPYAGWCPSCDWNVVRAPSTEKTRFARLQTHLVRGLYADITHPKGAAPDAAREAATAGLGGGVAGGAARVAGYVLACLTHLLCPAFFLIGVYFVTRWTFLSFVPAFIAFDLAWLLRPRPAPFPAGGLPLTREAAPDLFALLDRVGAEVGAPRTDLVAVSGAVNASFMTYGRRRRRVVEIGYPLWLVLTPQERVALLAHEMAHSGNGDGRHGLVVGSALHSLGVLRDVTRFDWQEGDGMSRLVAEAFLAVLGLPVRGLIMAMELLLYRSAQRAEYRADELAARAAGTTATISLLDALITRADPVHHFLDAGVVATRTDDLWTAIRSYVESLPESERERLRRAARLEELRVDRTHPPTYLRMSRLAALPHEEGRVRAPGGAIGTELAPPAARVAEAIREDAQSALYH